MMSILENNRIKKMMGLLKEDEIIRNVLTSSGLKNDFTFKKDFNAMLKKTFSKTGNWGTANNPQINCFTNEIIVGKITEKITDIKKTQKPILTATPFAILIEKKKQHSEYDKHHKNIKTLV